MEMKVKLTDEELNAKREELGRVLRDIADAERAVLEATDRAKMAKEHVNVLNERHHEISRIVASGEEERDGQMPLPLSKEEKKAAKKERSQELPTKAPVSAVEGIRVSIAADAWSKLSEDDQRRVRHHATACGAAVIEQSDGTVAVEVVPRSDAGTALVMTLKGLGVPFAMDPVNVPLHAPEAKPSTVPAARVLILGACWEALNSDQRESIDLVLRGYGVQLTAHDAGGMISQAIAKTDGLLKQLLGIVEENKLAFEIIDTTITGPITGELPAPATPSTPEEIVARSKWLHVVLNKLPDGPWTIVCESDEKKDAIAEFNTQHKLMRRAGGEARRYEHKTLKRQFPMPKEHVEEPQQAAAN